MSIQSFERAQTRSTLFGALLDARDRFGRNRQALEDPERQPLTFGRLVLGALVLGRKLAGITERNERVGVLLPNVQGLAVTIFGLNAYGRVPAMLNFTAGIKNLKAACEVAEVRTIVTSRRFVDQAKLEEEIGDLLFATVNLARKLKVDAEVALQAATDKFVGRFHAVEAIAGERGLVLDQLSLAQLDEIWDEVKAKRGS